MAWDKVPILSSFEKAKRRDAYRKLARVVRGKARRELLSLDEVQDRLRLFEQNYLGIEPIPVASIVGTADRSEDFDRDFLPRRFETRARWRSVEQAFPQGAFDPIVVYKVGAAYFVVDGHHRVAVAKQQRVEYIDAEITELQSRYPLSPDADIGRIIHAEQQGIFMEESGLERARPEAHVEFSRPDGYAELLEIVKVHGYHLMRERNEVLSDAEISGHWYDSVYLPALVTIRSEQLHELFAGATDADLFLYVWQRRRSLHPERGGMTWEEAVRASKDAPPRRRNASR